MTDSEKTFLDEMYRAPVTRPAETESTTDIPAVQESVASPLDQFSFSIRHRVDKPFQKGHYEARLKLQTLEFIVSDTTLTGVIAQMTEKAETLLREGWTVRA